MNDLISGTPTSSLREGPQRRLEPAGACLLAEPDSHFLLLSCTLPLTDMFVYISSDLLYY